MDKVIDLSKYTNAHRQPTMKEDFKHGKMVRKQIPFKRLLKEYDRIHLMVPDSVHTLPLQFMDGLLKPEIKKYKYNVLNKINFLVDPREKNYFNKKQVILGEFKFIIKSNMYRTPIDTRFCFLIWSFVFITGGIAILHIHVLFLLLFVIGWLALLYYIEP